MFESDKPMSIELKCLHCRKTFTTVKIEPLSVNCPHCGRMIFQYRFTGEEAMTPEAFRERLDDWRGHHAINETAKFFIGKRQAFGLAGALVVYLWPILAKQFEVREVPS